MQLLIIAVGHKMPSWIRTAFEDYAKRMPADCAIRLAEVKPVERAGSMSAEKAMAIESTRIDAVLPKNCKIIVLDERGRDLTSMALAGQLEQWQQSGQNIALIIGGADGIDPALKARADGMLRISSLTLPHGMVRVILAEQLYRAWSINRNHPYHRV